MLIAWVRPGEAAATIDADLVTPVRRAIGYGLDGVASPVAVQGRSVQGLRVAPGAPCILLIDP